MKIECVIVSVGYGDFLAQTLPHNLALFDRVLVITSFDDAQTKAVCHRLSVDCRPTDVMFKDGDHFAKGRAIDYGLGFLRRDNWLVQLDADIYLPPTTRQWLEWSNPDTSCIYGIDRVNCVGFSAWQRYLAAGRLHQHQHHCMVHPPPFPLGTRIALREHGGYVPIGFFQMWNGRTDRRYPLLQGSAEHTDVLHALQWPAEKRRFIPEIIAVHLESERSAMGKNWAGRKTRPFGPGTGDEAAIGDAKDVVNYVP
jgi:hypothetical protein